jgi:acetyl-CoA carboxylase biotin carboxylase subunit
MFDKILIANRGEIAVRVIRACRKLGIHSVAIHSEPDRDSLAARLADEAVECGPARASESYLDSAGIVEIARRVGADAVHPGYGFLSENAGFAEAVVAAGIAFIGPPPDVIRSMGRKLEARARMAAVGIPVVPGSAGIANPAAARESARALGFPVLVKASAGGGGRGMRRADDEAGLEAALARAVSEAQAAFGDGAIYLEKCLAAPRHVEIQILADGHGRVLHLGERECSIQRRHQKLIEEAPAFGMTEIRRAEMGDAAIRAARSVGYVGAGTCEFLVDSAGDFHFLEMNTRIQVEHPVTEALTGLDLVEWQIRIAAGAALPFEQADISFGGHAIEARVYAEDPDRGFLPSPGEIVGWVEPEGPGIRLDAGYEAGGTVTSYYDPLIAKLITSGRDRAEAIERLARALDGFWIAGPRTGLPFLRRLVRNPVFREGRYDTGFIDTEMSAAPPPLADESRDLVLALTAHHAARHSSELERRFRLTLPGGEPVDAEVGSVENPVRVRIDGREIAFERLDMDSAISTIRHGELELRVSVIARRRESFDIGLWDRVVSLRCVGTDSGEAVPFGVEAAS